MALSRDFNKGVRAHQIAGEGSRAIVQRPRLSKDYRLSLSPTSSETLRVDVEDARISVLGPLRPTSRRNELRPKFAQTQAARGLYLALLDCSLGSLREQALVTDKDEYTVEFSRGLGRAH